MRRLAHWRALVAGLGTISILHAGCGSERVTTGNDSELTGTGTLVVEFEVASTTGNSLASSLDASSPPTTPEFESVFLTFDAVRVYPMEADCDSSGPNEPGDPGHGHHGPGHGDSSFVEILTDPLTVDLTELDEALAVFLGQADLPAGEYSHIRLGISDAWAVTLEEEEIPLRLPGRTDPSLMIVNRFVIEDGEVLGIAILIDLSRSIHETPPGSGNFVLRPVLWSEEHPGHGDDSGHHDDDSGNHGDGSGQHGDSDQGHHDDEPGEHGEGGQHGHGHDE